MAGSLWRASVPKRTLSVNLRTVKVMWDAVATLRCIETPQSGEGLSSMSGDSTADEAALGLRDRKKRRTRLAIERAVLSLTLERGYEATTVEDICAAAEVSRKTLFNYFPSKEAALTGATGEFPSAEEIVALLERSCEEAGLAGAPEGVVPGDAAVAAGVRDYLDVIVDLVGSRVSLGDDDEVVRLRLEVMRSAPELFFRGQRSVRMIQHKVCEAIVTYLDRHPERRRAPGLAVEQEAFMAVSTALSAARIRSMLRVQSGVEPSLGELRTLLAAYVAPEA